MADLWISGFSSPSILGEGGRGDLFVVRQHQVLAKYSEQNTVRQQTLLRLGLLGFSDFRIQGCSDEKRQ